MDTPDYSPLFKTIYDGVVALTDRPELVRETEQAILRSTLRMHHIDFFWRDKTNTGMVTSAGRSAVVPLTALPRLRKPHSVTAYSDSTPTPLTICLADQLFKDPVTHSASYIANAAIINGSNITIRARNVFNAVAIEYYMNPETDMSKYDSWIASTYPFAIIDDAAATVFYAIGANEQGGSLRQRVGSKERPDRDSHIHTILQEQLYEVDPGDE